MESAVSTDSAYVQEQFTLTVSLWYAAGAVLFGDFPPPPKSPTCWSIPSGTQSPAGNSATAGATTPSPSATHWSPSEAASCACRPRALPGPCEFPRGPHSAEESPSSDTAPRALHQARSPWLAHGGVLAPGQEPHPRGDLCPGAGERSGRSPLGTNPSPPCRGHCGVRLTPPSRTERAGAAHLR